MALTKREALIAAEEVEHFMPLCGGGYRDRNGRCCPAQTTFGLRHNSLRMNPLKEHVRYLILRDEVCPIIVGSKSVPDLVQILDRDPKEVARRLRVYAERLGDE